MIGEDCADAYHQGKGKREPHQRYSADSPKRGLSLIPMLQPTSAAANHIHPCNEPDATPPTKAPMLQPKPRRAPQPISSPPMAAANRERAGGQLARANGPEP